MLLRHQLQFNAPFVTVIVINWVQTGFVHGRNMGSFSQYKNPMKMFPWCVGCVDMGGKVELLTNRSPPTYCHQLMVGLHWETV